MTGPVRLVALYACGDLYASTLIEGLWCSTWPWTPPAEAVEALGLAEAVEDYRCALQVYALDALTTLDDALNAAGQVGCHRDAPGRFCVVCDAVEQARAVAIATCARALVEDVPARAAAGLVVA